MPLDTIFKTLLDDTLAKLRHNDALPETSGATAGWWRKNKSGVYEGGIVYTGDVELQGPSTIIAPPNDRTLWEIGSTTKSFTGALLVNQALATSAGLGSLQATVLPAIDAWIPSGTRPSKLSTASYEQLVTMSAGWAKNDAGGAVQNLFDGLLNPNFYPGGVGDWIYSNTAFAVIGYALTSLYGVAPKSSTQLPSSYEQVLVKHLLEPLKIDGRLHASVEQARIPWGWNWDGNSYSRSDGVNPSWPANAPAGALTMSAGDLQRWIAANMVPNAVLDAAALGAMRVPLVSTGGNSSEGENMGRGWFLKNFTANNQARRMVNKNGAVPGFKAGIGYADPLDGDASVAGVFVAANISNISPVDLNLQLLESVLSDPNTAPG